MPALRYIPTTIPCEATVMEDIEAGVDGAFDAMVAALTKPLTPEEITPKPKEAEKPARVIFKGSLEEVNRFFYKRGWTDGLPVIPPTEEAVAEMLTGTDLPPDHLLGKLESRLGKATVEKIAVNAVMAGALPTYMPVLIAGTKLLLESEPGLHGLYDVRLQHRLVGAILDYQRSHAQRHPREQQLRRPQSRKHRQCRHRPGHGADHQEHRRGAQRRGRHGRHGQSHEIQHGDRRERRRKPLGAAAGGVRLHERR